MRPYAILPPGTTTRELLKVAKCYGGGGTSSTPMIPPEFAPLINSSVGNMIDQQGFNPISQYNAGNPMGVQGMTQGQDYGMGAMAGSLQTNPMQFLAAQAAQRAAGMAGAGPTTGQYDPSNEMSLQDWGQYMNPYMGQGGEMGQQTGNPVNPGGNQHPAPLAPSGPAPGTSFGGHYLPNGASVPGIQMPGGSGPSVEATPGGGAYGSPVDFSDPTKNVQRQGYLDVMAGGSAPLQRRYGNMTPSHFDTGANGMPKFGDITYSGGAHEMGGNPSIADYFMSHGASKDDLASFLMQGQQAFNAHQSDPAALANMKAHPGTDIWGTDISDQSKSHAGMSQKDAIAAIKQETQDLAAKGNTRAQAALNQNVAPAKKAGA